MSQEGENNNNYKNDKIFLLTNIFHSIPNSPNRLLPLISSPNDINTLFSFLNCNNENSEESNINSIKSKIEILNFLSSLFKMNSNLIFIFIKKCKSNVKSFFVPLIDIYLNELTTHEYKTVVEDLLKLLVENVSIPKDIIEYVYQRISAYFRNDAKIKLNENLLLKYLNLLDLFYTYSLVDNSNNFNNNFNEIEKPKEIKNFIYLNGYKNKLSLILNNCSPNINTDFPTLENGCSIIFWVNLDQKLIESFFVLHKTDGLTINLVNIILGGHQIILQLISLEYLVLVIDDIKSNLINFSTKFNYNEWNSIALFIYPKKNSSSSLVKTASFYLYINNNIFNVNINFQKNFVLPLEEKINSIVLFENLIGKVTSLLYFSFAIDEEKVIPFFNLIKEPGFHKIKYLYKFFLSNDKDYHQYSKNNKFYEKFKNNINKVSKIIDINLKDQNIKNLMCFLCPFCYDNKNNQIDDVFGNFIGILSNEDGVNNYINYSKNIKQLGGMNNLLPIAELMLLAQKKKKNNDTNGNDNNYINYNLLDKNILTENTFLKYLTVIKKIIIGNKLNLSDANHRKFFSCLGLFFEKFPSGVYTNNILNIFLEIGKEVFQYNDDKDSSFYDNFVNMILLNEKIFSKFTDEIQQKLWEGVHEFFTSDYLQMKDSISMSKICLLLRFYDNSRYDKFCCKKHAELFMPSNDNNSNAINDYKPSIMKPEMKTKINKLFETIKLYMDKLPNDPDTVNLFKLLSLDLSPCLQIKIIQAYIHYFSNKKIHNDIKSKVFDNLLRNNFFDIFEYVLSISLLDVRIELIDLLKIIYTDYKIDIENYSNKKYLKIGNFMDFVGKNLLPTNLEVEIDLNKTDEDKNEVKIRNTMRLNIKDKEKENGMTLEPKEVHRRSFSKKYISLVQYKLNNAQNDKKDEKKVTKHLLIDYFNNKIYEKDVESMWKILNDWLIERPPVTVLNKLLKQELTLQINPYVITFCIEFVSKSTPFYIDTLLIILYSFLRNDSIINRDILYTNESFYPWLIETIYFFYDEKNGDYFKETDIVDLIKQHSIELLKEFISKNRPKQENEARMNYIFDYAYHLKGKNNDINNVNKIGETTRLILSKVLESSNWEINLKTKFCFEFIIFFKNSEKFYDKNINGLLNYEDDENDVIRTVTYEPEKKNIFEFSPKIKLPIKKLQSRKDVKSNIIFNQTIKESEDNSINKKSNLIRKISNNFDNKKNTTITVNDEIKNTLFSKEIMPKTIINSLFLNEDSNKKTLKEIWKDFNLYDYIIDNFSSNIWGIVNLCKKVKIEYKGEFLKACKELIKEYSINSKHKNILLKDLYKCLNFAQEDKKMKEQKERSKASSRSRNKKLTVDANIKSYNKTSDNIKISIKEEEENESKKSSLKKSKSKSKKKDKKKEKEDRKEKSKKKEKEEKNKTKEKDRKNEKTKKKDIKDKDIEEKEDKEYNDINVLNINLILLCLSIDITKDKEEKEFLENRYEQFLLFCILCTLNISQSEKFHEFIQLKLYDLIGYGLLFLKQRDEEKYKEIIKYLIVPIFEDISHEQSKKIKNIFTTSKINIYKNSALYELFILGDKIMKNSLVNSMNLRDTLTSRTRMKRTSSFSEKSLNDFVSSINESTEDIDENEFICDVIYEQAPDKKGKIDDKNKIWVTFVGDSNKLKRHIINSTVIFYMEEKRKKYLNHKIVIRFKDINDDNASINYELKLYYINNDDKDDKEKKDNNVNLLKKMRSEKARINNVINNLIPFLENQIKKYSNTSFLQEKIRRNTYKFNKKRLFSWRGFWSERYIFYKHPEYLKYKIKNHLTKDMTKIVLTPILDIEYYMPKFSKFDNKNLFNEGDYKYKINLDIDDILSDTISDEINEINENGIDNDFISELNDLKLKKNYYGFNYLECIYKLSYNGLWDQYKNYYEQKFNFESNTISNISRTISLSANFERMQSRLSSIVSSINIKNDLINCCLVKLTHHIKGFIRTEKYRIKFNYCPDDNTNISNTSKNKDNLNIIINNMDDDPTYDKDMGACFGSTFKCKKSDKDKISLSIDYDAIQYFFIRYYFYQETGLEIYTTSHKNYYFNFKNSMYLHRVINEILSRATFREIKTDDYKGKKTLGYEKIIVNPHAKKKNYHVDDKMMEWHKYKISTLEYIMWMNIYGGRSLNDLTQYPVFPWLIIDYTSDELNPENEKMCRNLFLPMGMIDINEKSNLRKETFLDTYSLIKNDLKENFHDFNYNEYLKKGDEYFDNFKNKKPKIKFFERSISNATAQITENDNNDNNASSIEFNQIPSYYGSHYSNPTYVTHFLTRIFPFSFVSIEIQGDKFDDPNRMFISIFRTFESASTLKDDVRELIPEFYTLPEIFQNKNNLNLAQGKTDANNDKIIINDVELPPWSDDVPCDFITKKRKILEKSSLKINKWIDIIFGSYQRGEKAEEIHNIFQAQTYERMVKIDNIKDVDMRNALMRLVEVGMTPMQILDVDSKPKLDKKDFLIKNPIYSTSKGNTLDESTKLVSTIIETQKYKLFSDKLYENPKNTFNKEIQQVVQPIISKIIFVNQKLLKIFINDKYYYTMNFQNHDNKGIIEESNIFKIENYSSKYAPNYQITRDKIPFLTYKNDKYIIKAGFWDNRIEINSFPTQPKEEPISNILYILHGGPVMTLQMSEDEKYLLCGTKFGYIYCFAVKDYNLEIRSTLNMHSDEITSIAINNTLNMFATASMDGYVNIHILPSFVLVNSIQLSQKVSEIDISEDEFLYANNVFLSSCPLACVVIFMSSKKLFRIFSINGGYISEVGESEDTTKLNDPTIFKNLDFQEFLIYGTDDGYIKIRSFPDMNLIEMIKPFEGQEIKTLAISPDKRYCFAWSHSNKIVMIKDASVTRVDIKEKEKDKDKDKDKGEDENEDEQDY